MKNIEETQSIPVEQIADEKVTVNFKTFLRGYK